MAVPTAEGLTAKLQAALEPSTIEIKDVSNCGCGSKFEAIIVSDKFEGVKLLERQRMVNDIIKEEMTIIHAFSMKCWTTAQHAQKMAVT